MRTEASLRKVVLRGAVRLLAVCLAASGVAQAQSGGGAGASGLPTLTSPLGSLPSQGAPKGGDPAADGQLPPGALPPMGQGAGQHSPNSPFAPLPARADVVPWSVLTAVRAKTVNKRVLPAFPLEVNLMNQTTRRIQGFMMPLTPGNTQTHFLVSSVPLTCSFCTPGGPESMVEVRTKTPVKYSMEGVVVEGKFHVLPDDPQGLFYRMTDAVAVK